MTSFPVWTNYTCHIQTNSVGCVVDCEVGCVVDCVVDCEVGCVVGVCGSVLVKHVYICLKVILL